MLLKKVVQVEKVTSVQQEISLGGVTFSQVVENKASFESSIATSLGVDASKVNITRVYFINGNRRQLLRVLKSQQKIGIEYTVMTEEMDDDNIASLQMNMNNTSTFEESFKEEVAAVLNVTISTLTVTAEEPVVTKKVVYVTVTETVAPTPMPTATSAPGAILTTTPFKSIPATTTSVLKTTTAVPRFCPFQYTNLDAKNPCLLNVCQNSTDNMACKDGISIYCLESKHVNNGTVETGCIKISENPMLTATTTTTTSATRFCPYKYGGFANAPNPCTVPACEDNSESDSCKSAVHKYCGASKETYM